MKPRRDRAVVDGLQAALFAQATAAIALADFLVPLDATEAWAAPQIDEYDHLRSEYVVATTAATKARALAAREPARA